jgi:hypothetical protein
VLWRTAPSFTNRCYGSFLADLLLSACPLSKPSFRTGWRPRVGRLITGVLRQGPDDDVHEVVDSLPVDWLAEESTNGRIVGPPNTADTRFETDTLLVLR